MTETIVSCRLSTRLHSTEGTSQLLVIFICDITITSGSAKQNFYSRKAANLILIAMSISSIQILVSINHLPFKEQSRSCGNG